MWVWAVCLKWRVEGVLLDYSIRPVTTDDVAELQKISRETIKATFDPFTAPDDMAHFLDED